MLAYPIESAKSQEQTSPVRVVQLNNNTCKLTYDRGSRLTASGQKATSRLVQTQRYLLLVNDVTDFSRDDLN